MTTRDLEQELAPVLARSRFRPVVEEAAAIEAEVRSLVARFAHGSADDVRCYPDGGDLVVAAPCGRVRLWRQAVTGWWLADEGYSPERAARKVAQALVGEA